MNRKLLWISLAVILMAICHGAETMAYRFAGEPVVSPPVAECPLLKQAPAPTPFVAAGDVLHDLTGVFREKKVLLENGWAIWNQSQRLLVVHGGMLDQWRVEELSGFREQELNGKLTIDWLRSEKLEDPTKKNPLVFASMELRGKSGKVAQASTKVVVPNCKWSFSGEAQPAILDSGVMVTPLSLGWKGPDGESTLHGNISIPSLILDGDSIQVASWNVAGHGPTWHVNASGESLLSDGMPWLEARLRQEGGKITICRDIYWQEGPILRELPSPIDRKLWTIAIRHDIALQLLDPSSGEGHEDQSAEEPKSSTKPTSKLREVVIPTDLDDYLAGTLLDLRSKFMDLGLKFGESDLVAMDPVADMLVVIFNDDQHIDGLVQLVSSSCGGFPANVECSAWLNDSTVVESPLVSISLLNRLANPSTFELLDEKDQPIALFNARGHPGPAPEVELNYDFLCHLQQPMDLKWHSQAALTLANGVPVETDAAKRPDGRKLKLGLRARVITSPSSR